jgi:hypothetical protein
VFRFKPYLARHRNKMTVGGVIMKTFTAIQAQKTDPEIGKTEFFLAPEMSLRKSASKIVVNRLVLLL